MNNELSPVLCPQYSLDISDYGHSPISVSPDGCTWICAIVMQKVEDERT